MNVNGRLGTCGGGCEAPVLRDEASIRLPLSERPADGKRSRARSPPHDPGVRHRKRRFREGRRLPGEHVADPCRRSLMQLAKEEVRVHESRYRMARTQVAGKCRGFEVTIASKSEATPAASTASGRHGCTVGELPTVGRSPTRACRWSLDTLLLQSPGHRRSPPSQRSGC